MPSHGRTLVVGDIQGCADELGDLLQEVGFVEGSDHLITVGDLINRGPKSLEVLRRVRQLGGETVLGNHERYLLGVIAGGTRVEDTLAALLEAEDLPELLDWLVDRPEPLVILRDGWVVVHAGFPPGFRLPDDAKEVNAAVREAWPSARPGPGQTPSPGS